MDGDPDFSVRFWGTRGSIACPGHAYERYGGNTSCLEVRVGGHLLCFDAGTGLRRLGAKLMEESARAKQPVEADLFLTHTHHDHIMGLPFFVPMFCKENRIRMWAGHLQPDHTLNEILRKFMVPPLFPVPPSIFAADVTYHDFEAGDVLEPKPGVFLRTTSLNHPNGATGYRIEYGGRAICYVTDTEHNPEKLDENILGLIEGADMMIYDCSYTDEEYPRFKGWGHSTWQEGARLCDAADVKRLVIFHHDPSHDDAFMDRVADEAEAARPGTVVAQEGSTLTP